MPDLVYGTLFGALVRPPPEQLSSMAEAAPGKMVIANLNDGSFYIQEGKIKADGTYRLEEKTLVLKVTRTGGEIRGTMEPGAYVDSDGLRWKKQ